MDPVESFYDDSAEREWERLERHRLEFAITLRALSEYLPPLPARIADIGGSVGRYAIVLSRRGYSVTLVDLSARCLDFARGKAAEAGVHLEGYLHADARELSELPDGSFDAALMMGPLYHLLDPCDRLKALREAHRILRPDGLLFAAFLTRYSPITATAVRCPERLIDPACSDEMILRTGTYRKPEGGGFTDAWFARPAEISALLAEGGFASLEAVACESLLYEKDGPVSATRGDLWERWVDVLYRIAKDPSIHAAAGHLLHVALKSG